MARYKILINPSVAKDLKGIPKRDVQRILAAIRLLASDPRPPQSKKLSAQERYRLRQGNYRILYTIENDVLVVCVIQVGHRRDVYRRK